ILNPLLDFLFAISYDCWSISDLFLVISVFLWSGNDVMPISPLGVIADQISRHILKGSSRLLFAIYYNLFVNVLPFPSYKRLFVDRKLRHAHFSTRWRLRSNIKADS